jgi:tetratricopeptide (TPR) repeat protein
MASVYSVVDETVGRRLALKRLTKAHAGHVALFEREYRTLATLRHPSIVEVYDYATDDAGPYYTMELLDGGDVSSLVPMVWPETCRVMRSVASALALLHARRLVHRDVSPRNVWRTPDGGIRLIDFGAMAAFGRPQDVAGTPPFIAPESLHGLDIDQRVDLYALGALGYFLLSGRHAYPAQSLAVLETVWRESPRSIKQRVRELERPDLPDIPPALEALLESLLSQDRLARPTTAADVIDRLNVIASLEPDTQLRALESYLSSPTFVGRAKEREVLRASLNGVLSGLESSSVVIEARPGVGRTRLLREFALEARLAGAAVLQCEARVDRETHGVALECVRQALDGLPAAATLAQRYAATLGHLSPELCKRLSVLPESLAIMPKAYGEARQRIHAALVSWFLDLSRESALIIIADDIDLYDEGSAAWIASLAREARPHTHKLGVFASVCSDRAPFGLPVQALGQTAMRLVLQPLTHRETAELFRSVFGDRQHVARLVDRIHQRSGGTPALAIELAEHLGRQNVITYADGAWVLPQELRDEMFPATLEDAEIAHLHRLPQSARALAQSLSIREGSIDIELCKALGGVEGQILFDALDALTREGVLVSSASGYRFARESQRKILNTELTPARRCDAHRRLGEILLASNTISPLERLKAGLHLLDGEQLEAGSLQVAIAAKHYSLVDLADLGAAWPSLETALDHFRRAGRSSYELAPLMAALALAGYYADRRLADRYGKQAVELLQTLVGLKLARRLRALLGRKGSVFLALGVAAARFAVHKRNPLVPSFRDAMLMLFNCVAALSGACIICSDPDGGEQYASVIEPLTALGPSHVASFMHQFCLNLTATIRDRLADARKRWIDMLGQLDGPRAVHQIPENVHVLYAAGAHFALGVIESWREEGEELKHADRLDAFRLKLYELSADQLRMMHYGNRGQLEEFQKYRERVETHAIQRGTAWQVEMWTFSQLTNIYIRWGYVAGLKECMEQLKRLSAEVPSLRAYHARAVGAYLLLRGSPNEALEWLGRDEAPRERVGWARGQGLRARAYNELGDYASAHRICLEALNTMSPGDLEFTVMNLGLEIELARTEALLDPESGSTRAENRLRGLLERYAAKGNPITLGSLHEALAELATWRRDTRAFQYHLCEVERWFRSTANPALIARYERLLRRFPETLQSSMRPQRETQSSMNTLVHNLKHGGDSSLISDARWTLDQMSRYAGMTHAFLFSWNGDHLQCVAQIGEDATDSAAITAWVADRLQSLAEANDMETSTSFDESVQNKLQLAGVDFYLTPLVRLTKAVATGDPVPETVGAIVTRHTSPLPFALLHLIAERIRSATRSELSTG